MTLCNGASETVKLPRRPQGCLVWSLVATLALSLLPPAAASAQEAQEWRTSSSLVEPTKYPPDWKHYDHVNPDAPKGGTLNAIATGTFDSLNPYIVRGSPAAGLAPFGGGLLYDTLMEQSIDEPGVSHALVADAVRYPDDYSSATYRLNPAAKWHDGKPITVEDVIWSFGVLKAESPYYRRYYENVVEAVEVAEREIEFRFDQKGNRELPKIIGDLVVLPKHWWEGTDARGQKRDITRPTLEAPLGSGPYRIESFKPGQEVVWTRVTDYWAQSLPVRVGRENVDRRRYLYIQDRNAAWQAFTKGGFEDIEREMSARDWMTKYKFPAIEAGDVVKKEFKATATQNFQGFAMNLRRPLFADRNVRKALTLTYDFETLNRTMSFGLNKRVNSYFIGGDLASTGLPQGPELALLEPFRDKLPVELFTTPFALPVYAEPKDERANLQQAIKAFADAGWRIKDGRMTKDDTGQPFEFEILSNNEGAEATLNAYINSLRKIGITARLRFVDPSQYVNRLNDFDYDVIVTVLAQSESPGNEQRDFWSSASADQPGSRNYSGIKDPVVDALVDRVIFATNRDDLVAATHALDRVLLWNYYYIPQFTRDTQWLAVWNKFGIPPTQPTYLGADTESWWIDPEKEKALAAKYGFAR